jgi:serine/threonine-protein kinase
MAAFLGSAAQPDAAKGEKNHWYPSLLPGGRGVLFTIRALNPAEPAQVAAVDLKTGQRNTFIRSGSQAEYVPTGHLLYAAAGTVHAVRFDLEVRRSLRILAVEISVGAFNRAATEIHLAMTN